MILPWLSIVGLVLDIFGVVLVWRFGLPHRNIDREGRDFLEPQGPDAAQIRLAAVYDRWAHVGLALLVAGFLLQIGANVAQLW